MKGFKAGMVAVIGFFGLCSIANYVTEQGSRVEIKSNLDAGILNCLPRDVSEQTVFTIERRKEGGEYLSCERHKRVVYAQASKGKPYRLHLAMGDK